MPIFRHISALDELLLHELASSLNAVPIATFEIVCRIIGIAERSIIYSRAADSEIPIVILASHYLYPNMCLYLTPNFAFLSNAAYRRLGYNIKRRIAAQICNPMQYTV